MTVPRAARPDPASHPPGGVGATDGHAPPRRRTAWWLGWVLVVTGLTLTTYLAWSLVGTNIAGERRHAALVVQIERGWDAPVHGSASGDRIVEAGAGLLVRIPRFGDDFVVPVLEGTGDEELASGFGHVENTAQAGGVGNHVLAAHRITHGEPLRHMPSLRPGDTVLIEGRDAIYTYELDTNPNDLVVDIDADWVLAPHPDNPDPGGVQPDRGRRLLTLLTCAELFHTDDRMVVFGHLVGTRPK